MDYIAQEFQSPLLAHLNLGHDDVVLSRAEPIAGGAFGDVFRCRSRRHRKDVAVKRIRSYMLRDGKKAKRIVKEVKIWAKLMHPNVLPLLGIFVDHVNATPNLVSEWMVNGTASRYMRDFPRGGRKTFQVVKGIAAGLEYLHYHNVTHADLKCENILISPIGIPLLADFGISLSDELTQTMTYNINGSHRYMARELIYSPDGTCYKHCAMTDMWSFGMVVYELLSGKVPYHEFVGAQLMLTIVRGTLPDEPGHTGHLHYDELWRVCGRCWNFEQSQRPTSLDMLGALDLVELNSATIQAEAPKLEHGKDLISVDERLAQITGLSKSVSSGRILLPPMEKKAPLDTPFKSSKEQSNESETQRVAPLVVDPDQSVINDIGPNESILFGSLSLDGTEPGSEIADTLSDIAAELSLPSSLTFGSIAVDVSLDDLRLRWRSDDSTNGPRTPSTALSFGSICLDDLHLEANAVHSKFDEDSGGLRFGSVSMDDLALLGPHYHRHHRGHRSYSASF